MHHGLNNIYIYAVTKIEIVITNETDKITIGGTGFFIKKDDNLYLITNRHVVQPEWKEEKYKGYKLVQISFDRREYNVATKSVDVEPIVIKSCNLSFASNNIDDIACITGIIPNDGWSGNWPVCIEYSMLATSDNFEKDLSICDSLATIGFPVVYDHKHKVPILRAGIISSDPRLDYSFNGNDNGHVLAYEAFSTPGASGSPVFAIQKGFKLGEGLQAPEGFYRPVLLIGINAGSINLDNVHQQMSYLFKSDQIIKLINSAVFGM